MTDRSGRRAPAVPTNRSRRSASRGTPGPRRELDGPFTAVGDRFYRQLVLGMRNGVLAVTRDGRVAIMNEVACRILEIPPLDSYLGQAYATVLAAQPDMVRILSAAFDLAHLPNRAELRLKPSGKVIGYTLSHDPRRERPAGRRGGVLQGPDAGRADGGARTPPRSARGARRDGGGHRARGEEPAGGYRGGGGPAAAPGRGRPGRAVAGERHHQRGQDRERHRHRGAGVRAADPAAGRADVDRAGAPRRA